jgi:alanine racemase
MKDRTAGVAGDLQHFEVAGRLTIDLAALKANWLALARRAEPAEAAAVVKADAYGLGIERVVPALSAAGCKTFFVAILSEARRVRTVAPDATVYVLEGLAFGAAPVFRDYALRPVLGSLNEIDQWAAYCREISQPLPAAVHIDTGMTRLGLTPGEAEEIAADPTHFDDFRLALVMSHLACADVPDNPMNGRQLRQFQAVRRHLPEAPASLANSAGTLIGGDYRFDLVRPGVAIYGGRAIASGDNPMRPVVTVEARIIRIREAAAGTPVGYGAVETLKRDSRLAILSAGYADGYIRAAGSTDERPGADVTINGRPAPVVGRVSMDLLAVDITEFGKNSVKTGDYAELLGKQFTVDDLADRAGTIGYEVLTNLGRRFQHVVKDD